MASFKAKPVGPPGVRPSELGASKQLALDIEIKRLTAGEDVALVGLDPKLAERSAAIKQDVDDGHKTRSAPAFSLMASQMSRAKKDGPITVRGNVPYPVTVRFGNRRLHFQVQFTDAAANHFASYGSKVDLADGSMVWRDGTRNVIGDREAFIAEHGTTPPPFTFFHPDEAWVVPKGTMLIGVDQEGFLRIETKEPVSERSQSLFHTTLRATLDEGLTRNAKGPLTAEEAAAIFRSEQPISDSVKIIAPSETSAQLARTAFDQTCGKAFAKLEMRMDKLQAEYDSLRERTFAIFNAEDQVKEGTLAPDALDRLLDEEKRKLGLPKDAISADVTGVLTAKRAEITERMKPVEIVVLPKGVHLSDLPEYDGIRDKTHFTGELSNIMTSKKRSIYVSEEDLGSGREIFSRHELYHYLEDILLSPAEREKVDQMHAKYVASGGPFPRLYGIQRHEFLTVASEEFEGGTGSIGGPRWLKDNMPDVYDFLKTVTGRDPAA